MIKIYLGLPGSGKTACAVREIYNDLSGREYYTNIVPKQPTLMPYVKVLKTDMLITKEVVGSKRDGTPVYESKFNEVFWTTLNKNISVVIDEAHIVLDSRRSMSKINKIMNDWMALIRRVLGSSDSGYGELILITQLPNRIDIIAREMATSIHYHICHFYKRCQDCGCFWPETSETPEPINTCPKCGKGRVIRENFKIEVLHFRDMEHFEFWKYKHITTYHKRYFIRDIENYFPFYDTLQWDNLISEAY